MSRIYLDHAATTPMVPAAIAAMTAQLARVGNASSLHGSGREARRVVEESRELVAACVGARPAEVIFTSGGTESDNLAVKGGYWAARERDAGRRGVVTSAVEHHAVLDSVGWLGQSQGSDVHLCGVDAHGRLDLGQLGAAVDDSTAVVSVMWANNEVGTVQPIAEVVEVAARYGAVSHSDAMQAVGHLPVRFAASGLDMLSLTGHKLGGPCGVGALLVKRTVTLSPIAHGGGQERDVRSGTVDVAAIAGFAAAVLWATQRQHDEEIRLRILRRALIDGVVAAIPDSRLNGVSSEDTLPGVVNLAFKGCQADAIVMLLDAADIDCSTGSACSAGVSQPSHVLQAMGRNEVQARSAVRFSLGHTTSPTEIDAVLAVLPEAVLRARLASAV